MAICPTHIRFAPHLYGGPAPACCQPFVPSPIWSRLYGGPASPCCQPFDPPPICMRVMHQLAVSHSIPNLLYGDLFDTHWVRPRLDDLYTEDLHQLAVSHSIPNLLYGDLVDTHSVRPRLDDCYTEDLHHHAVSHSIPDTLPSHGHALDPQSFVCLFVGGLSSPIRVEKQNYTKSFISPVGKDLSPDHSFYLLAR